MSHIWEAHTVNALLSVVQRLFMLEDCERCEGCRGHVRVSGTNRYCMHADTCHRATYTRQQQCVPNENDAQGGTRVGDACTAKSRKPLAMVADGPSRCGLRTGARKLYIWSCRTTVSLFVAAWGTRIERDVNALQYWLNWQMRGEWRKHPPFHQRCAQE